MDETNLLNGEHSVYPGHPVTLAYLIMRKYKDFPSAATPCGTSGICAALADSDIPGAGGCVAQAIDLLSLLWSGVKTAEEALSYGNRQWENRTIIGKDHPRAFAPGQAQADRISDKFLEQARFWYRGATQ